MIKKPTFWPEASAVFDVPKTLVMATDAETKERANTRALVVSTPLELIRVLEFQGTAIASIVLTGKFARDVELAAFICDHYPLIEVVVEDPSLEAEAEWHRHAELTLVA